MKLTDDIEFKNDNGVVWHAGKQFYILIENPKLNKCVNRWKESMQMTTYFHNKGGVFKQFCLPRKKVYLNRVVKMLKQGGK